MLASSDKMSPNMFSVRITSNCFGSLTNCMAQLSTSICSSVTSGYSFATSSTTFLQSLEASSTFALSTLVTFFRRFIAISNARFAILRISFSLYVSESYAVMTPFSSTVFRSPKYSPPVNSRMIIMSKPPSVMDSFNGQAPFSSSYRTAGRRLANRFNSFRILKSPASGRFDGSNWYHGEVLASPPIDPISTASHFFASATVSSVSGTPCTSMDAPPKSRSVYWH